MAFALRESRDAIARINITPLADVMLVLLAIVMLSLPALTWRTPFIVYPPINDGPLPAAKYVHLVLDSHGVITWNGTRVDVSSIEARIAALPHSGNISSPLLIEADDNASYATLVKILAAAHAHGIENIDLRSLQYPYR